MTTFILDPVQDIARNVVKKENKNQLEIRTKKMLITLEENEGNDTRNQKMFEDPPDWFCPNCNSKDEIPLRCSECDLWICSACWLEHDVKMMKEKGLLKCPCGEQHD